MGRIPGIEIVRRAYKIWEDSGKPEGKDDEFYHRAERELEDEQNHSEQNPTDPPPGAVATHGAHRAARLALGDRDLGIPEELLRLVVHGVLHATGHDHPVNESRTSSPMWKRQELLLARFLNTKKL